MTVIENILVGMHYAPAPGPCCRPCAETRAFREEEARRQGAGPELMDFVGLTGVGDELARNLPYGVQRRVEIARALASAARACSCWTSRRRG